MATIEYDFNSRVISATDQLGRTGSRTYNAAGYLTSTTNAKGETTTYNTEYYNVGIPGYLGATKVTVTDGNGHSRFSFFTGRGDLYKTVLADGTTDFYSYDGLGQVTAHEIPTGDVINYTYNSVGQLTGINYPTGYDPVFAYDSAGRPSYVVDETGVSAWGYASDNSVNQHTTPQGLSLYATNSAGLRTAMTELAPNGSGGYDNLGQTTYSYDSYGRSTGLTNSFNETTSVTYDSYSRPYRTDYPNGTYEVTTYDILNRPLTVTLKNSSNTVLNSRSYTYDAVGQITSITEGGTTKSYGYDNIGQLVSADGFTYTYDANGNRTGKFQNSSAVEVYEYDAGDKITAVKNLAGTTLKSYSYDAAGRTTAINQGGNVTSFTYDYESRVKSSPIPIRLRMPTATTPSTPEPPRPASAGQRHSGGQVSASLRQSWATAPPASPPESPNAGMERAHS